MPTPLLFQPRALVAAALLAVPAVVLTGCSPGQHASTQPGTTPKIWTAASAPSTTAEQPAATGEKLTATLKVADGTTVATADFAFANGFATVTVKTTTVGRLTPGFHGLHLHEVGKCEPNSVATTGGAQGDFNSAGGHLDLPGRPTHPHSGDLTSLQVRADGSAELVTTTDSFTVADLTGAIPRAIIIHEGADNFGNIPADRYQQINGTPGPDEATMATGDAGKRVACGVIGTG
jgi:Cu-Zn family superoxide dismutase